MGFNLIMKYYLDEKEVTLEEIRKKKPISNEDAEEAIEFCKIEPDTLYFTITLY